ncbi:MAG: prepilin-type N-terminal cleavage/methylation domain-containing protein [Phycisphaeraceae bacterium]|nr:prepilin-type N-terminal cleavage/methylation domain-containing protein [Phycisphaerales bacterium]MCB9842734.1 prepilin-type N-terminal cleavage/methylation domain-containing protein [Phycisphaeraceae bacterium]
MTPPAAPQPTRRAFTLIELMVAVIITAAVAGGCVIALSQSMDARTRSHARQQARSRAETAAGVMARDIANAIRSGDMFDAQVFITDLTVDGSARDEILLFSRSDRRVRSATNEPESGEYEVQYRVVGRVERDESGVGRGNAFSLWRRMDPVPDEWFDSGGVATAIGDGVVELSISAFDGEGWYSSWNSDQDGYPHAIRIDLRARDETGRYTADTRRVIALDRTPPPYATAVESEQGPVDAGGAS